MKTDHASPVPAMPSPFRLIATLGLIAMLSGFTIVLIYQVTLEPIARNHREALEQAVFHVLPGAVQQVNFRLHEQTLERLDDDDLANANVFAGFDANGQLIGVALQGSARGYAGEVRVLYGYSPDSQTVIGFKVLQSSETPGLGDKIEIDPRFLANFDALDVRVNDDQTALVHPVVPVKHGQKTQPWQIDGITGATVSSFAVGRALGESTAAQVPVVYAHRDQLTLAPAEEQE
jgi:Na+-translocating ferredoxin:NAD+ oxidoreductase subunit G